MTTLNLADIPTSVDTVEKLVVWASGVLRFTTGNTSVVEIPNGIPEPVVQTPVIETPTRDFMQISRVSIKLDPAYYTDTSKKFWEHAQEITQNEVPAGFKA